GRAVLDPGHADAARSRAVLCGRFGRGVLRAPGADLARAQVGDQSDLARRFEADGDLRRAISAVAAALGLEAALLRRAAAQHLLRQVGLPDLLRAGLGLHGGLSPVEPPVAGGRRAAAVLAVAVAEQRAGAALCRLC